MLDSLHITGAKGHFLSTFKSLLLAIIFIVSNSNLLQAQPIKQFSSRIFSVNEGLLANHIVDMAEDNDGFIWLSFGAGLQRFNGNDFEVILPCQGLPETNHPHFFKLHEGDLWLSYHRGISAYNLITGKFQIIYKTPDAVLKKYSQSGQTNIAPVMPVMESENKVWCWSAPKQQFIAISKQTHQIIDSFSLSYQFPEVKGFKKDHSDNLLLCLAHGIAEINFPKKELLHFYHFPKINKLVYDYSPLGNHQLLLATNVGIFEVDLATNKTKLLSKLPGDADTTDIARISLHYLGAHQYVLSVNNQLYVFNAASGKYLYRMVNRQNQNFIEPGYITSCMTDSFHNLWLMSFSGLTKINFSTLNIKYYGLTNIKNNFSRCIFPDKKANLIITGSLFNQLSLFDTTGRLLKHFSISPATAEQQVSCILKCAENKYLVFAMGKYAVYLLNTATMRLSPLYSGFATRYYPLKVFGDSAAILASPYGIVKAVYSPQRIYLRNILNKSMDCAMLDVRGHLWIGNTGKYTLYYGKNFKNKVDFFLNANVVTKCFYQDNENSVWLGTEAGLYKINPQNGAVIHIYNKSDGLADGTIYSIEEDNKGNIWCSTNKGISCIYKDGKVANLFAADGLQGNEFNTQVAAKATDGELFFGGTNGVNSFFPNQLKMPNEDGAVILQHIKVMDALWHSDTVAWHLHNITLPYSKNIIEFDFSALGSYTPDMYKYWYRLVGLDKTWVNAGNAGRARYALNPGKYIFEYTAGVNEGRNLPVKSITIIITPAFWQTSWFKILVVIAVVFLLWATFYFYNKRKYQKKLQLLKMEQSLQKERQRISRDLHDNIGAYTTALTADAEQLNRFEANEKMRQTAKNISANAKNIIGSLQETIWVLNNETITITDFSDRLKVYARKMLQHRQDLQIRFHESIENNLTLTPGEALNIFRIMQEALHNVIKHSGATLINVEISSKAELTILSLSDNGTGFDTAQQYVGNGLSNMLHRCEEAGYQLKVESSASGTTISLIKDHSFAV